MQFWENVIKPALPVVQFHHQNNAMHTATEA